VPARAASGCVRQSATQLVGHLCVKLTDSTKSRLLGERRGFGAEVSVFDEAVGLPAVHLSLPGPFCTRINAEQQPALGGPSMATPTTLEIFTDYV
jgi:hypothetical protein